MRLALQIPYWIHNFGGILAPEVHEIVQQFGNLEELLVVEQDLYDAKGESLGTPAGRARRVPYVAIDLAIEEIWGHNFPWLWSSHYNRRVFDTEFTSRSLVDAAKDFESRLRRQKAPVVSRWAKKQTVKTTWSIPSVRFVVLVAETDVHAFYKSRQSYREYVKNKYWELVNAQRRRALEVFYQGQERQEHNDCPCCCDYEPDEHLSYLLAAKEALCPEDSDPYSARAWAWEIADGQLAMEEMDSWPWRLTPPPRPRMKGSR